MKKKNAHNTEKSQQNSNCSTNCNIKITKCTLSLTKIKRNEKTKSGATSKTKFALIILIFIHKLSFKKDKKQQSFIKKSTDILSLNRYMNGYIPI